MPHMVRPAVVAEMGCSLGRGYGREKGGEMVEKLLR